MSRQRIKYKIMKKVSMKTKFLLLILAGVKSTIYFHTKEKAPLSYYETLLIEKFKSEFSFFIAVVAKENDIYMHRDNPLAIKLKVKKSEPKPDPKKPSM